MLILARFLGAAATMIPLGLGLAAACLAISGLIAAGGRNGLWAALLGIALAAIGAMLGATYAGAGWDGWVLAVGPIVLGVFSYLAALEMNREMARGRRSNPGRRRRMTSPQGTGSSEEADG